LFAKKDRAVGGGTGLHQYCRRTARVRGTIHRKGVDGETGPTCRDLAYDAARPTTRRTKQHQAHGGSLSGQRRGAEEGEEKGGESQPAEWGRYDKGGGESRTSARFRANIRHCNRIRCRENRDNPQRRRRRARDVKRKRKKEKSTFQSPRHQIRKQPHGGTKGQKRRQRADQRQVRERESQG